jgi:hypothetical protein
MDILLAQILKSRLQNIGDNADVIGILKELNCPIA